MGLLNNIADLILGRRSSGIGVATNTFTVSKAGESVNSDNVMENGIVLACLNVIQEGISQLPIKVARQTDLGLEMVDNHPLNALLARPNTLQTPSEFKASIVYSLLVYGNAFIRIQRSTRRITSLVIENPEDVKVNSNTAGIPVYQVRDETITNSNMIHIRDMSTLEVVPKSRVMLAADLIGAYKAANRQMGNIFKNGVDIKYFISEQGLNKPRTPDELEKIKESIAESFSKEGNGNSILFLTNGIVNAVKGMTPADADLRALRQDLIREIAGVFAIPGYLVGGTSEEKYNNVRQRQAALYRDTFLPIITRIEEALSLKLLTNINERIVFDVEDLLKGDGESQSLYAERAVRSGILTPNEAREHLGRARLEQEGTDDLHLMTSNNRPMPETGGEDGNGGAENEGNEN